MRPTFLLIALLSVGLLSAQPSFAAQRQWLLSADAWYAPRDGQMVRQLQPVSHAVEAWMSQPGANLAIRYPGGEEGTLWARELRDWLVSLGVPSKHVRLSPGFARQDAVAIVLSGKGDLY